MFAALCLVSFCFGASSDHVVEEPVPRVYTHNEDPDDEEFHLGIPEEDEDPFEFIELDYDRNDEAQSILETSNFFTVDPDIYQDWRYLVAASVSDHLFTLTNLETHPTSLALTVVDQLVFGGQLNSICDSWNNQMATLLHGPGHMRTAIIRALSMLGIMDLLNLLKDIKFLANLSFPETTVKSFSRKQFSRLFSLTFKMEIVRVPFVMEKLRVIANEEDLTNDDFSRFLELLGDMGVTHSMPWFRKLWQP
jgi:hypothetical protein